jgi:serine/threonine protein phosphatase PrpC
MRTAHLRGRDHGELGAVAATAEGPAAIALSRGGAPKTYEYVDPNEDAACFALGPAGALVGVADGHRGCEAAEEALARIVADHAPAWTGADGPADATGWRDAALAALWRTQLALREAAAGRPGARTTVALALARFAEARLYWVSLGDSHVFRATPRGVHDLAAAGRSCPPRSFLGGESLDPAELAERAVSGDVPAPDTRALVLATDGVSGEEVGLEDAAGALADVVERAARGPRDLRPLEAARGLVRLANDSHLRRRSGDNVAVAVLWSEPG